VGLTEEALIFPAIRARLLSGKIQEQTIGILEPP